MVSLDMLQPGEIVRAAASGLPCRVEQLLGGGGQGEVYRAVLGRDRVALKWYLPASATADQRAALEALVRIDAPDPRFLWPMDLAVRDQPGFGYIMPLREARFTGLAAMMGGEVVPSFRIVLLAALGLTDCLFQLHARGLCYRDVSFNNVFLDAAAGDVLVCDNDNVVADGGTASGVAGTVRFIAPEIVRGEARPNADTDRFSLAVLLFYMLLMSHPLEGKREAAIHALDAAAMNRLYGHEPVFIFDPKDRSNAPVPGYHVNALTYWAIYPGFLRALFTRSFTDGLADPRNGRVRETEWRNALSRLLDSIAHCPQCGQENFYDREALSSQGKRAACWSCGKERPTPARIRVGASVVVLNRDSALFAHHLDAARSLDHSRPVAAVAAHPSRKGVLGLRNLGTQSWSFTRLDGTTGTVTAGRSITLSEGLRLRFGATEGVIRLG